jgi:RNA polymerase primary sigma factor
MGEAARDPVTEYLDTIERLPGLSLTSRLRSARDQVCRIGGRGRQERLIEASRYMVPPIARRYEGRRLALTDLIQEGNLGLARAVSRFDPDEHSFADLAQSYIDSAISKALAR